MTQWEYETTSYRTDTNRFEEESLERLNTLGEEGWEVTTTIKIDTENAGTLLLLKRPRTE